MKDDGANTGDPLLWALATPNRPEGSGGDGSRRGSYCAPGSALVRRVEVPPAPG